MAWKRTSTANGAFSVEVPCSAQELTESAKTPDDLGIGVPMDRQARVLCFSRKFRLVAGLVEEPALAADGPVLFDLIAGPALNEPGAEGSPALDIVKGRRALLNRQEEKGIIAQTGIIELGWNRVIMLIAGSPPDQTTDPVEFGALIDRFTESVEVSRP